MTREEIEDLHVTIVNVLNSESAIIVIADRMLKLGIIDDKDYEYLMSYLSSRQELIQIAKKLAIQMREEDNKSDY